ncbi:hypothetical protein BDV35DRAFT_184005 [Aspergillus flavus]|uniref:V-type ATPase, C subunit family protein n=3 Tax=Aspergillus subgen. Circumdati TaxID=2720871 RepID=A0A1S9DVF5_ASPOZ|nr:hypothetical protein Ao3042_09907 [Aspergillus oryzae 3.042]KAB8247857.1 hypothetical protein BDV35DRAFT_184005 [Aspergillus flavus]KDE82267.1 hypothetical protein AO1008_08755 [Aspergillus oryzae 100-8]OOO13024.1 hypothetical protein OAory_01007730 [Aspergillus oryzae]RAQ66924.1 hypothetical protein COH21_006375 [Aspergillus flavus]|eukprot:EIT74125.1 hypothetical protein Ao3042_09907 [Aspergillus oryzae 3.042]
MSVILGSVPPAIPARLAIKPKLPNPVQLMSGRRQLRQLSPCLRKRPQRCFATQTKAAADHGPLAQTWLTRTPKEITPDDVLSSLPSIPPSLAGPDHIPILLLTPSLAQWADTTHSFFEQCINRLYRKAPTSDSPEPVHAVVAIVDRLPDTPSAFKDITDNGAVTESEGISLLFARTANIQGRAAAPRRLRSSETEEPALVFSFQAGILHGSDNACLQRAVHEVGLRLANTLFINGNENTLFGTRWSYDPSSSSFTLDRSVELSRCRIASTANSVHNAFGLPLHPVGQRREVISSMGNIIRQLAKHPTGTSKDPMPASSELEKELPRYIEEHNVTDHRVSVWALVEPPSSNPQGESDDFQTNLVRSVQAGGKLHRVMSGGGGWGKKQGLLSLDYETRFLGPYERNEFITLDKILSPFGRSTAQTAPPFEEKSIVDDLSSLSQVARAGDYIQFYVSVEPDHAQISRPKLPDSREGAISYQFGVVFDNEMPIDQAGKRVSHKDLRVKPNYFGALSEKAMTYSQPIVPMRPEQETLESGTKLDIPGCRVNLVVS